MADGAHCRYYRGLEIMPDLCIGCSHCMKVCPTEALRVKGGKAVIHTDLCIDCGRCYRECPTNAIRVVDDDFDHIFDYKHRLLLVPSLFYSQFEDIEMNEINRIIGSLGLRR